MTDPRSANDTALLHAWNAQRDAEAFAELVQRYSALTYRACRRVLGSDGQAEEVAQECFLALAQGQARKTPCLGAWIHRVATNRALNRLRAESRRRRREDAYARSRPGAQETTWDDLQPHVDAAINALPEKFRLPVVMHFLEGKSHQECADILGLPRTTLSGHIARGVSGIRDQLARKGLVLSAVLLADLLAGAKAHAVPPSLAAALGKLALSGPPAAAPAAAAVAVLALKWAAIPLLAAVLLTAYSLYPSTPRTPASITPESTPAASATLEGPPSIQERTANDIQDASFQPHAAAAIDAAGLPPLRPGYAQIHGRVTGPSGLPVQGAQLDAQGTPGLGGGASDITSEDGAYAVDVAPAPMYHIAAMDTAAGLRTEEKLLENIEAGKRYEVDLIAFAGGISGIVVNSLGQPLTTAHVMAAPESPWHFGLPTARANGTGRFAISGLFPGSYELQVQLGDGPWQRLNTTIEVRGNESKVGLRLVYPDPTGIQITGVVVDPEGNPIEHARVEAHHLPDRENQDMAWSDSEGLFTIDVATEGEYFLQAAHRNFASTGSNRVVAGADLSTIVMEPRGGVEGVAVNARTGRPLTRFEIYTAIPVSDSHPASVSWEWRTIESAQGAFALENLLPGEFTLKLRATGYADTDFPVDIPSGQIRSALVVPLKAARLLQGSVVDEKGSAVVGAQIYAGPLPEDHQRDDLAIAKSGAAGRFEIKGLDPDAVQLSVLHYKYAPAFVPLREGEDELRIVLDPGTRVHGRVLANGLPVEGAGVSLFLGFDTPSPHQFAAIRTGSDGRYELTQAPRENATLVVRLPKVNPGGDGILQCFQLSPDGVRDYEQDVAFEEYGTQLAASVTADDAPLVGAYFILRQTGNPEFQYHGHIGDAGNFHVQGLPPGPWELKIFRATDDGDVIETADLDLQHGSLLELNLDF